MLSRFLQIVIKKKKKNEIIRNWVGQVFWFNIYFLPPKLIFGADWQISKLLLVSFQWGNPGEKKWILTLFEEFQAFITYYKIIHLWLVKGRMFSIINPSQIKFVSYLIPNKKKKELTETVTLISRLSARKWNSKFSGSKFCFWIEKWHWMKICMDNFFSPPFRNGW